MIGILGGTFDPIHYGHLHIAEELIQKWPFSKILFLPNQIPPHRPQPIASLNDRIEMIKLAIAKNPHFQLDLTEAERPGPSYMFDTLTQLRARYPNESLVLILGADVFEKFNEWHRYKEISNLAHILIVNRPLYSEIPEILKISGLKFTHNFHDLQNKLFGFIFEFQTTPISISATEIRQKMKNTKPIEDDVPKLVVDYIYSKKIY